MKQAAIRMIKRLKVGQKRLSKIGDLIHFSSINQISREAREAFKHFHLDLL